MNPSTLSNSLKKRHNCDICNKTFTSTYKLKSHLFYHKAVASRFKCTFCLKEFYRKDEFNRHLARHRNEQKMHVCDHCGRGFVDKRNLVNHLYIHDDLHVPAKRYHCIACDVSYCEERLLKYHIRKHHMNLHNKTPVHTNKKLNDSWIEPVKDTNKCVQITKITNNMLSIRKCKIKGGDVKYEAETCIKKKNFENNDPDEIVYRHYFESVFALKDNLYSKAICDYCNKEMLKKSLIVHIRERHSKMRRFHCFECNRGFNRHYHLADHVCGKVRKTKNN